MKQQGLQGALSLSVALVLFVLSGGLVAQQCLDAPPLEIRGKHFYNTLSGELFVPRGIAYYPRPNTGPLNANNIDLFTEEYRSIWERDIEEFKALNVNAIRIYAVDPSKNHDAFMCALKSAGIYVVIELGAQCFGCAITDEDSPACYPLSLKTRGEFIISVFAKYDNVMAFSAGNEVALHFKGAEKNGPCQKKFVRDMRAYIQSCSAIRDVPIGLAVADLENEKNALYYNCRTNVDDELETVEWYGLNTYRHCSGTATDFSSINGFASLIPEFSSYNIAVPVMLVEFGCTNPSFPTIDGYAGQRSFLQARVLYTPEYMEEFAGGFVFEYSAEMYRINQPWPFTEYSRQNFGVGYFSEEDCNDVDTPCEYVRFPQFYNLSDAYGSIGDLTAPPEDKSRTYTECPLTFAALDDFDWPTDSIESWTCPDPYIVYCPVTPGCPPPSTPALPVTDPPTDSPILASVSASISPSPQPTFTQFIDLTVMPTVGQSGFGIIAVTDGEGDTDDVTDNEDESNTDDVTDNDDESDTGDVTDIDVDTDEPTVAPSSTLPLDLTETEQPTLVPTAEVNAEAVVTDMPTVPTSRKDDTVMPTGELPKLIRDNPAANGIGSSSYSIAQPIRLCSLAMSSMLLTFAVVK